MTVDRVSAQLRREYRRADKRAFAFAYLENVRAGRGDVYPPSDLSFMGCQCIARTVHRLVGDTAG